MTEPKTPEAPRDLRAAVEGLPRVYRAVSIDAVLALIPPGSVVVTAETLAETLLRTEWWTRCHTESRNEWTSGELAAAILARLQAKP